MFKYPKCVQYNTIHVSYTIFLHTRLLSNALKLNQFECTSFIMYTLAHFNMAYNVFIKSITIAYLNLSLLILRRNTSRK